MKEIGSNSGYHFKIISTLLCKARTQLFFSFSSFFSSKPGYSLTDHEEIEPVCDTESRPAASLSIFSIKALLLNLINLAFLSSGPKPTFSVVVPGVVAVLVNSVTVVELIFIFADCKRVNASLMSSCDSATVSFLLASFVCNGGEFFNMYLISIP